MHPKATRKLDCSGWATYVPRSVAGVRYHSVDFGVSVHMPKEDGPSVVTGVLGRDKEPPELSDADPHIHRRNHAETGTRGHSEIR